MVSISLVSFFWKNKISKKIAGKIKPKGKRERERANFEKKLAQNWENIEKIWIIFYNPFIAYIWKGFLQEIQRKFWRETKRQKPRRVLYLRVSEEPLKTAKLNKKWRDSNGYFSLLGHLYNPIGKGKVQWRNLINGWKRKKEKWKWEGGFCFVYMTSFLLCCIVNEVNVSAFFCFILIVIEIFQIPYFRCLIILVVIFVTYATMDNVVLEYYCYMLLTVTFLLWHVIFQKNSWPTKMVLKNAKFWEKKKEEERS